jgi:hypothetical protein
MIPPRHKIKMSSPLLSTLKPIHHIAAVQRFSTSSLFVIDPTHHPKNGLALFGV